MYQQAAAHDFPGLDLVSSPDQSGCVDCLNVDFDRQGAVRVRDGYDNFTSSAGAARYVALAPFETLVSTRRLIAVRGSTIEVLNASGASVATQAFTGVTASPTFIGFARFGTSAPDERIFIGGEVSTSVLRYWDGSSGFGTVALPSGAAGCLLALSPADNRLATWDVGASALSVARSRIRFSAEGDPTTWNANDYVDLHPGDGEWVTGMVNWQESLFVFKESKFFVFYGNTTDSDGITEFNYRPIVGVGGVSGQGACAAPEGVYFCSRDGVYLTDGGFPEKVSGQIDPLFTGNGLSAFFQGSALNQGQTLLVSMHYLNGRVYLSYPSGTATANDQMLVYDTRSKQWSLWNIPAGALSSFRIGNTPELVFTYASGSNHVGRHSSAYSNDDGTGIVSRYRTGFTDFGSDLEKRIVKTRLFGTGTVSVQWSRDFGSLGSAKTAALGTSPAISQAVVDCNSRKGRLHSWQLGASSGQWTVHRLHNELDPPGQPDLRTT